MHVLSAKGWRDGYLRYHLHDQQIRISVRAWLRVSTIENAFITYDRSDWRKAVDYVRNIGIAATFRKVLSRLAERDRNRKYVAIGCGEVVEIGAGCTAEVRQSQNVGFIAPFHPAAVDEVCLHFSLVRPLSIARPDLNRDAVYSADWTDSKFNWEQIAGWSEWSGQTLDQTILDSVFDQELPIALSNVRSANLVALPRGGNPEPSFGRAIATRSSQSKKSCVIFGMGQYAKTALAPRIKPYVDIACWHEVDPTQIGRVGQRRYELRTSMVPCEDENYDVYFVAGFHHTHAPIAVHGLRQGADVVVEKPLATTEDQLEQLMDAISKSKGRYFAGFHKRYNPLNALIRRDVAEERAKPLSYHAIVHEIPLPARHWYHWPNSRGTIVSNACHWIDHFLFLNEFSQPTRIKSHRLANADIVLLIDLKNGASASIVITHNGSTRLGVREIVWVTAGDRTATIIDDRLYSSESSSRFIRQTRLHRYASSQRMYDESGQQQIKGGGGDSAVSVQVSTQAMLLAQNQLVLSGHARNLAEQDGV